MSTTLQKHLYAVQTFKFIIPQTKPLFSLPKTLLVLQSISDSITPAIGGAYSRNPEVFLNNTPFPTGFF